MNVCVSVYIIKCDEECVIKLENPWDATYRDRKRGIHSYNTNTIYIYI